MQDILKKLASKEILSILAVFILSFPAFSGLLHKGYFPMHDDIQTMRLWQMEKCFLDGQIPCRWASDMGAGFGQPVFNFYSAFPYYFGMIFRLVGFQFVDVVKILFLLSLVLSGVFMYFLAKEFFGRLAGIGAAIFYVYAPYHSVDIYVRGAMAESWAITFFPLIFYAVYKFLKEEKLGHFLLVIFSLSGLFLSHNLMNMVFSPFVALWALFSAYILKKWRTLPKLLLALAWSVGLSAFFLLPVFGEKSLVAVDRLTEQYFDFHYHFVYKGQLLFSRFWGYGGSLGQRSLMSFQIGWPHWWFVPLALSVAVFFWAKKKYLKEAFVCLFFVLMFFFTAMLTHRVSTFIWEALPLLAYVQFPWRFLGLVIFAVSLTVASLMFFLKDIRFPKMRVGLGLVTIASAILLNFHYFKPLTVYTNVDDQWKLNGKELEDQMKSALLDYLPKGVEEVPENLASEAPWIVEGEAKVSEYAKRSNFWRFTIDVSSEQARIRVPIFDFPRWEVLIDQQLIDFNSDNPQGVIELLVPQGSHTVVGFFRDTKLRTIANMITMVSFVSLIVYIVAKGQKNEKTV